jgi:hypothetical protein
MKRTLTILFIVLFFAACVIPTAGMIAFGPSEAAANEIKVSAPRLKNWDGTWNTGYLSDLSDYLNKGFALRLSCITGWDTICAKVFHTSANGDVILGPNGWLFYRTSVNTYTGADVLSDRDTWCCSRRLYLMQEYAESIGAQFLFASPQGKETLYPEQMPDYVCVSGECNRVRLDALLDEMGVHWCDLYMPFAQSGEQLYWSWDSHWNGKGAALAADCILGALGRESDYFGGPFNVTVSHQGDLYAMLFPASRKLETDYAWAEGFTFTYESAYQSPDDMRISTVCADGKGSLLMYRDSSGRNLYPYLAQQYEAALFSRSDNYNLLDIEACGATDVIVELADRDLDSILKYPAVYPAPARDAAVLDGAQPIAAEVSVTVDPAVAGYSEVTGALPDDLATDSPVYLCIGDAVYEAMPGSDFFTAWVRGNVSAADVRVYAFTK